jgi:hypothetical protein
VLDHHAKADGTQKKQEINDWVTLGKCILIHFPPLLFKRKIPRYSGDWNTATPSHRNPQDPAGLKVSARIPALDAFMP